MLPLEHSAMLSTFIKLPCVIKNFVLSILSGCFTQVLLIRCTTHSALSKLLFAKRGWDVKTMASHYMCC